MTTRSPLLALALTAALLAGCNAGGDAGDADLTGIADGGPFEKVAYNVGYQSGLQFLGQDSSFNYDRFKEGFDRGLAGDSTEIAYALGLQYGLQIRQDTLGALDRNLFLTGLRSALAGDSLLVTAEAAREAQAIVEDSLEVRRLKAQARTNPQAQQQLDLIETNAASSERFLAEVAGRDGVRRLGEGVLYTVDAPGEGASPGPGDRVSVLYKGMFADGTVFDESGDEPATFAVGQVVPGFRDALLDMVEGETRTVYIPADQAYGLLGSPGPGGQGGIPPNSALQFEMTLVEVLDQAPRPQGGQGLPPGFGQ